MLSFALFSVAVFCFFDVSFTMPDQYSDLVLQIIRQRLETRLFITENWVQSLFSTTSTINKHG